ncbi:CRISPR-associated protein Cas4 [Chitinophaga qingshengii]|uniref:CRISPR-associated exonuclease Cas4 n=1 Tax=Chitinophaga qingshengii TaxID=1569794 RepID=A0ABR7THB2_9BACT|nr:CRISPR-associated protein Cas4 [Chitinophaga qingshengii]MBC9929882.1 CRISPR-associated protein Cas4 [Chitinophaga qingshengii]
MQVNATLINLYHICQREMWFHTHGINMEHNSDIVYDGKLLHETSYPQRPEKYCEIELSAHFGQIKLTGKIDFYDAQERIIHEIKRSNKAETAHEWQVKFYIWLLQLNDILNASAILEYPKIRTLSTIQLTSDDIIYLQTVIQKIACLQQSNQCPKTIQSKICKSCSYFDLCYIDE